MAVELAAHQIEAIDKMKTGCVLQGGTGAGKSRTAIAYFYTKVCDGELVAITGKTKPPKHTKSLYIITTARKRDTLDWEAECAPFMLSTNQDVSICQIKVTVDSWNNIKKFVGVKDSFFIFDEQRVGGHGVWSRSFVKIAKNNDWILLSATPGDRWLDYISIFVANGFYKNESEFYKRHVVLNRFCKYRKVDRYLETKHLVKLRDSILIKMDFDRETEQHHITLISDYDKLLYKRIIKTRWNPWKDEPVENISELCQLLRKVTNEDESKIEQLNYILSNHKKVIIFYNFDYELEILRNYAKSHDILCAEWNGHKHELVPNKKEWMYLVQYNSGAEGWNCITTDTIIFFSQSYSYKMMHQASGRIDRLTTPYKDLYYYHLRSNAPIDIAIKKALDDKKDFNESRFFKH